MRNKVVSILANPDDLTIESNEEEPTAPPAPVMMTFDGTEEEEEALKERQVFLEIEKFRIRQAARDKEIAEQKKQRLRERLLQLRKNQERMAAALVVENAKAEAREKDRRDSEKRVRETAEEAADSKRRRQEVIEMVNSEVLEESFFQRAKKVDLKFTTTQKPTKIAPAAGLFSAHTEEEESKPKRLIVPIDYEDDKNESPNASRKRKQKELVDQIPTEKDALFAYSIDWETVQKLQIAETSLRPWIVKKMVEYLGEEERTLINFIIAKISNRCEPTDLLSKLTFFCFFMVTHIDELAPVLDEEAEQFVIKLWRMLIFSLIAAANA